MSRGKGELPRFQVDSRKVKRWEKLLGNVLDARTLLRKIAETQMAIDAKESELNKLTGELSQIAYELNDFEPFETLPQHIDEYSCESCTSIMAEKKDPAWWLKVYSTFCVVGE